MLNETRESVTETGALINSNVLPATLQVLSGSGSYGSSLLLIEKLRGMANYAEEQNTAETRDRKREQRALVKFCLMVDVGPKLYVRSAKIVRKAWENLEATYEDKGVIVDYTILKGVKNSAVFDLYRTAKDADIFDVKNCVVNFNKRLGLVDMLLNLRFLSRFMAVATQLADINKPIEDDFIAVLIMWGLTPDYCPMCMALENSGVTITSELVKQKLSHKSVTTLNKLYLLTQELSFLQILNVLS